MTAFSLLQRCTPFSFHRALFSFRCALGLCCGLAVPCANAESPSLRYEVVARYAHLQTSFTEGLELHGDTVYESSGLYQNSFVAIWQLPSATLEQKQSLPAPVFGEGLTIWGDRIYVLTWREHRGFIFDKITLKKLGEFAYAGEGWGLTHNDGMLIMSDGTDTLRELDPQSFEVKKNIRVTENGLPIDNINELEWIPAHDAQAARLLANIWQRDEIVAIDPENGRVTARIVLNTLYPKSARAAKADVLNGIAYDARDRTLLVTGKLWPTIYRIKLLDDLP